MVYILLAYVHTCMYIILIYVRLMNIESNHKKINQAFCQKQNINERFGEAYVKKKTNIYICFDL